MYREGRTRLEYLLQDTDSAVSASAAFLQGTSVKDLIEMVGNVVTTLGILADRFWALFVFGLGRTHAGVVQVDVEPKRLVVHQGRNGAIVSVTVKNTGRTKVEKVVSRILVRPMRETSLTRRLKEQRVTAASLGSDVPLGAELFAMIEGEPGVGSSAQEASQALEPGQVVSEEVLVSLGDHNVARVEARHVGTIKPFLFVTRRRNFSSRTILNIASLVYRAIP